MGDVTGLVERLEKATAGSAELSARVMCALAAPEGSYVEQSAINGNWCIYDGTEYKGRPRLWEKQQWHRFGGWPVTESLDAALALVERCAPNAAPIEISNIILRAQVIALERAKAIGGSLSKHLPIAILIVFLREKA